MSDTILHFMWGYQRYLRVQQKLLAESVFNVLDDRLLPEVFLVGVRPGDSAAPFEACVEPEDDHWVSSDDLHDVLSVAATFQDKDPESKILISTEEGQRLVHDRLQRRALRDAIRDAISKHPRRPPGAEYFVSLPVPVGGYCVAVVLGLQTAAIEQHPRLSTELANIGYRQYEVARSLIDAAVKVYLADAEEELRKANAGLTRDRLTAEEVLRRAAERLTQDCAVRAEHVAFEAWSELFTACTRLASSRYEKAEARGRLILAREAHPSLRTVVALIQTRPLEEARSSRKLLELASKGLALHTNGRQVFGLVAGDEELDACPEDVFEILVVGHHRWELRFKSKTLMGVSFGSPYLPRKEWFDDQMRADLPRLFHGIDDGAVTRLISLVATASTEEHGTLLVVTPHAESEAKRLQAQSIQIEPTELTPELLKNLTAIDGALILDTDARCRAIGVILDGEATADGDPARGARFNSALRYVQSRHIKDEKALAVVVSADGGVDLVPKLLPRLSRRALSEDVATLAKLAREGEAKWRPYHEVLGRLNRQRFYLQTDECTAINTAMVVFSEEVDRNNPGAMRIVYDEFVPNENLDEDCYFAP